MITAEKNLVRFIRATAFMILCLLAFSAEPSRDSDGAGNNGHALTSEIQQIPAQAIPNVISFGSCVIHPTDLQGIKNTFSDSRADIESRLINQLLLTLCRNMDSVNPFRSPRIYLPVAPERDDDLPDLS